MIIIIIIKGSHRILSYRILTSLSLKK